MDGYYFRCQAVQNLGLAVVSIVTSVIVHKLGYNALEIFFISSLVGKRMLERSQAIDLNDAVKNQLWLLFVDIII